ncbi:hypothetical protein ACP70R_026930 [Stipagrostis hirtigluma subsp. patula]
MVAAPSLGESPPPPIAVPSESSSTAIVAAFRQWGQTVVAPPPIPLLRDSRSIYWCRRHGRRRRHLLLR